MTDTLRFHFAVFLRRLPIFIVVSAVFASGSVAVALMVEPVHRAEAMLLVEGAGASSKPASANSETNAAAQPESIEQRLLARNNLLEIASRFGIFSGSERMSPDQVYQAMRAATSIRQQAGRRGASLITIAFQTRQAATAAVVVNAHVTRILDENARSRTSPAGDSILVLDQEVERLAGRLSRANAAILQFENRTIDISRDRAENRLGREAELRERIAQRSREVAELRESPGRLQAILEAPDGITDATGMQATPEQEELQRLRSELGRALVVYLDQSPKVRALRTRIAALETATNTPVGSGGETSPAAAVLDERLADHEAGAVTVDREIEALRAELAGIERTPRKAPSTSPQLDALQRAFDEIQQQYESSVARLAAARSGAGTEALPESARISVLRPVSVASSPIRPDRATIVLAGTTAGVAISLAIIVILEVLNTSVRRPSQLIGGLGIVPMLTIPYLPTRRERIRRSALLSAVVVCIAIGVPVGLRFVHVRVLPLDVILDTVSRTAGL